MTAYALLLFGAWCTVLMLGLFTAYHAPILLGGGVFEAALMLALAVAAGIELDRDLHGRGDS